MELVMLPKNVRLGMNAKLKKLTDEFKSLFLFLEFLVAILLENYI